MAQQTVDARSGGVMTGDTVGILMILGALFLFSIQDGLIKHLSGGYSVFQIVMIRSLAAAPIVFLILRLRDNTTHIGSDRWLAHLLRATVMFTSYTSFYLAIAAVPLATVVALAFTAPLFVTAGAVLFFGEEVGVRRWGAILIGFAGVLVVVRPGGESFEPAALFAVYAAFAYAASSLMARRLGSTESGAKMGLHTTFWFGIFGAALLIVIPLFGQAAHPSLAFATRAFAQPTAIDLGLMVACSVIAGVGFYLLAEAYRVGRASVVSPFEYSGILWPVMWGVLFFNEIPDAATITGIGLIIGSGLFVMSRENVRGRPLVTRRGRLRMRSGF